MRSLSRSELAVLGALLAQVPGGERGRIRCAGTPRTTYQSVRRRALAQRWVSERWVPGLLPSEFGQVRLRLLQPYAEHHAGIAREVEEDPSAVVAWELPGAVLSVHADRASGPPPRPLAPARLRAEATVTVTASSGGLPAFFDFEGAWAGSVLGRPPISYPQPWEFLLADSAERPALESGTARQAFHRALGERTEAKEPRAGGGPWAAIRQRRWERKLQLEGLLRRRCFLNPEALPPVSEMPGLDEVLVTGLHSDPVAVRSLLLQLYRHAGTAPFLFGWDAERVLFGALASPARRRGPDRPILADLRSVLGKIEIVRAPVGALRQLIPWQFGRPLAAGGPSGGAILPDGVPRPAGAGRGT